MKPLITILSLIFILWLFSTGDRILIASGTLFLVALAGALIRPEWILEPPQTRENPDD